MHVITGSSRLRTDPLTVIAEPFSWWVIEDFAGPRPGGRAVRPGRRPYEEMKLRLLAYHTALLPR